MPIQPITNQETFTALSRNREIAGIFFFWALDSLSDLAYWVAEDVVRTPQLYTNLDADADEDDDDAGEESISSKLARLRVQYGTEVNLPNRAQRQAIYASLFGELAGGAQGSGSSFPKYLDQMLEAAAAFAEKAADTGVGSVRQRVRDAAEDLKSEMATTAGGAVKFSLRKVLLSFATETVYPILRNGGIGARFGIGGVGQKFPFSRDPAAEKLVEEISKAADSSSYITRQEVSNMQRVAATGALALAETVDFDPAGANDAAADALATLWYRFRTAWNEWQTKSTGTGRSAPSAPAALAGSAAVAPRYPARVAAR